MEVTDRSELLLLVTALAEQGFYRSGERLVAPHGSLWLSRPMLELAGLDGLRSEAARRLRRTLRQRKTYTSAYDWECAIEDVEGLVAALDEIPIHEPLAAIALAS